MSKKKNIWEALDFENIEQYYDYIDESYVNGNFSQVRELMDDMTPDQKKGFFRHAREMGYTETVNWINEKMEKGGKAGKPKVESIHKYALSSDKGKEVDYDKFVRLTDADVFAQQKSLSVQQVKDILNDLEPDEELDKLDDMDDIVEYLSEAGIIKKGNTYNQSFWGNAIEYGVMGIGKSDGEQLIFLSMHIGGDVRGNYTKWKAYKYEHMEDAPFYQWNLIVEIKTNKGDIRLQSEGDEAYHFIVERDETGTWEENDGIKHPDLAEKLDMGGKDIWMQKGGSVSGVDSFFKTYSEDGGLVFGGYFSKEMDCGGYMEKGGRLGQYELKTDKVHKSYWTGAGVFKKKPKVVIKGGFSGTYESGRGYKVYDVFVDGAKWFGASVDKDDSSDYYFLHTYEYSDKINSKIGSTFESKEDLIKSVSEKLIGETYSIFGAKKGKLSVRIPGTKSDGGEMEKGGEAKTKRVKLKSGASGERSRLHTRYDSFDEFESYSEMYGLHERLGYDTAEEAWEDNPVVESGTNPSDFRKVSKMTRGGKAAPKK